MVWMLDLGNGFAPRAELAISRGVGCFPQKILCGIVSLPETNRDRRRECLPNLG